MSGYQLFLRQKILTKKDIPAADVLLRFPRGGALGQDYRVVAQYDLVWWPEAGLLPAGADPACLGEAGCFLTQFEAGGSA